MSITEIASTGLLRVVALPPDDQVRVELPGWTARALAVASMHGAAGVPTSLVDLPSTAERPGARLRKRTVHNSDGGDAAGKGSGDYRPRAKGDGASPDDDAPSTFDSLL